MSFIKPVVIIPVHLSTPTSTNIISFRQCGKILGNKEIIIISPEGLDLGAYRELLPNANELRVEPHWMASIQAYNRMMISPRIVRELDGYTHMLIHEPDAIVLKDELDYWCNQPNDYIGAPWFEGYDKALTDAKIIGVGNSGFSLHRLAALRELNNSKKRWYSYHKIMKDILKGLAGDTDRLTKGLNKFGNNGHIREAWKSHDGHCDIFWSNIVPQLLPNYKVAAASQAVYFSWEVLPEKCFEMTAGKPPFGIHAWEKYNPNFIQRNLCITGIDFH